MSRKTQSGFSLIELLIVMAVAMILMAMGAPLVVGTLNTYYLRQAGTEYANLIQTARMRAVQDDQYYDVQENLGAQAAGAPNAYVNIALSPTLAYQGGDPVILTNRSIAMQARGAAPNVANLEGQFLPVGAAVSPDPNAWGPSFGSRGLPCQATAAVGGTCNYLDAANNLPVVFESFFQSVNAGGNWLAVTVNPAGRIREWYYDAAAAAWRPLN